MLLKKSEAGDNIFSLVMSPVEWLEIQSLAKYAHACLLYDLKTPYTTQVFVYDLAQPKELLADKEMQAAFSAIDRAAKNLPPACDEKIVFDLPKEEMRQLFIALELAAKSEDQANRLSEVMPERFPEHFPDLEFAPEYYAEAFLNLLLALHEDKSLNVSRTVYQGLNDG